MINKRKLQPSALMTKADKALKQAVRKLIVERKQDNDPLIVWRNGKVVKIPAKEL